MSDSEESDEIHWKDCMFEHMLLTGVFFGSNICAILKREAALPAALFIPLIKECVCVSSNAFSGNKGYGAHVLYTYSALQLLYLAQKKLDDICERQNVINWLESRIQPDGSCTGDEFNLADTRFTYCVLASLHLLGQPIRRQQNISNYIARCQNDDGGFGMSPGSESHGGQTFCCIASLSLCDALELVDLERLHEWLLERQDSSGGFNGRPGKTCDACYAWWIGASLCIIGKRPSIKKHATISYLLEHQRANGGFSPTTSSAADLFHTHFIVAALALLEYPDMQPIDPVTCLPLREPSNPSS
eukprot:gene10771-2856_t